jgi:hypothetical protein
MSILKRGEPVEITVQREGKPVKVKAIPK